MFCFQSLPQPSPSKALHSCEGKEPGDLRLSEGDVMVLQHRVDEHWYHGLLPASHVQGVRPLPQAPPQGKALYDFEMKDRDQDKDCLTFGKVRWVPAPPFRRSPRREPGRSAGPSLCLPAGRAVVSPS